MLKTILKKDNINEFRRRKSYGDTNKQMQKKETIKKSTFRAKKNMDSDKSE